MNYRKLLILASILGAHHWALASSILNYTANMKPVLPQSPGTLTAAHKPVPTDQNGILTLKKAVLVAIKHNTQLKVAQNQRKLQRFDLLQAKHQFHPQFSFSPSISYDRNINKDNEGDSIGTTKQVDIGPSMDWTLPTGTEITAHAGYSVSQSSHSQYSHDTTWKVALSQPLWKNFGTKINEVDLENAKDQQIIDDLQLEQTISQTVSTIISDYYALVQARLSLDIANQSLKDAKHTLKERKAKNKFGRVAASEVTQAEVDLSSQRQSYNQAEQSYINSKAELLNDMGLDSGTKFKVNKDLDITPIHPDIAKSQKQVLQANRDYKINKLNYQVSKRNLTKEANSRLWDVNLNLSHSHTRSNTDYAAKTGQPRSNSMTRDTQIGLTLSVPLDSLKLTQSKVSQAINQQNAQLNMQEQKRQLMSKVAQTVQSLENAWQSLQINKKQVELEQKNYHAASVKAQYGKINAFTLSQQHEQLIQAENALVSAKINYLEQKTQYQQMMGKLLKEWHINIEASTKVEANG